MQLGVHAALGPANQTAPLVAWPPFFDGTFGPVSADDAGRLSLSFAGKRLALTGDYTFDPVLPRCPPLAAMVC